MEKVTVIISSGTRARIERIKKLRDLRRKTPRVTELSDEEILLTGLNLYWMTLERKEQ